MTAELTLKNNLIIKSADDAAVVGSSSPISPMAMSWHTGRRWTNWECGARRTVSSAPHCRAKSSQLRTIDDCHCTFKLLLFLSAATAPFVAYLLPFVFYWFYVFVFLTDVWVFVRLFNTKTISFFMFHGLKMWTPVKQVTHHICPHRPQELAEDSIKQCSRFQTWIQRYSRICRSHTTNAERDWPGQMRSLLSFSFFRLKMQDHGQESNVWTF